MPFSSHQRFQIFSTTTRESISVPSMSKSRALASMTVPDSSRMMPPGMRGTRASAETLPPYRTLPIPASARRLRRMIANGLRDDPADFLRGLPRRFGLAPAQLGPFPTLFGADPSDLRHFLRDGGLLLSQRGVAGGISS